VVRDGLRHPVPPRVGSLFDLPAKELRELADFDDAAAFASVAPLVAVQQAGRLWDTGFVDRRQRRHHRRDRNGAWSDVAERFERAARTFVPRLRGIVFESPRARDMELVGDPGTGDHCAVRIGRNRRAACCSRQQRFDPENS